MTAPALALILIAADFDGARALIRRQMRERQTPSVTVAVAQNGTALWEESWGWADRERRVAATPHTMYSLASVSKSFTATALMILAERGKLDFDQPVNNYLGDAKLKVRVGDPAMATVRRVANHSAGLPLHFQFFYADEPHRAPSRDESILRYANSIAPPGERYQYSNLGFGILDHLVTRLSGRSFEDFMRAEVFLPLGMTHTSVNVDPRLEPFRAIRYGSQGALPDYVTDHPGASEVYSSAHDLMLYGALHLKLPVETPILKSASIDEMHRATVASDNGFSYAMGFRVGRHKSGKRVVMHSGGMGGVSTLFCVLPDDKVSIAVLLNGDGSIAGQAPLPSLVLDEIVAALFPDAPRPVAAAAAASVPAVGRPGAEFIGEWTGTVHTYERDLPLRLSIGADGEMRASLDSQLPALVNEAQLQPGGYLAGSFLGDIRTLDANRRPYRLHLTLKLRGDALNGGVVAISAPGPRVGNALAHWVELRRAHVNLTLKP